MSLYKPSNYQVAVGSVVDPAERLRGALTSVGNLYQSYLDDQEAKRARGVQEQRQAEQDAMARELHQARMGEIGDAQASREFVRGYTPDTTGGRLLDPTAARSFAEGTAPAVERVLGQYGVGRDGQTIGDLSAEEQQELGSRLSSLGISEKMADVPVTREAVFNAVYRDTLRGTGNPQLANQLAQSEAARYSGREEIQAQEAERVKTANERLKQEQELIKYDKEQADKTYKQQLDRLKSLSSAEGKKKLGKEYASDVYKLLDEMDIGWIDSQSGREMINEALDAGKDPALIAYTLRNAYREGDGFLRDRDVAEGDVDRFRALLDLDEGRFRSQNTTALEQMQQLSPPGLTDVQRAKLAQMPTGARSYEDIMRARGAGAATGYRVPVSRPVEPVARGRVVVPERAQAPRQVTREVVEPSQRSRELTEFLNRYLPSEVEGTVVEQAPVPSREDWQTGAPVRVMPRLPGLRTDSLIQGEELGRLQQWLNSTR